MTISNTPHIVERLKACPFCRSEDVRTLPGLRRVLCFNPKCDAEMGGNTQADAIAAWNTRTPDPVITAYEVALNAILEVAPSLPKAYQWAGTKEDLFDAGLRHKGGKKPFDYLKSWLSMLRPFAYATRDDSWGEMEKLLCIVMRNYVRVAKAADEARAALSSKGTQP